MENIINALHQQNAILVAHHFTEPALHKIATASGGTVADSLAIAKYCKDSDSKIIYVAGTRFMAESIKLACPDKITYLIDNQSTCSLVENCPEDGFNKFIEQHPDRTVVVYINTSLPVKAQADYIVTSSQAPEVVRELHAQGKKILWAPDKHMANYIRKQVPGVDLVSWDAACVVHDNLKVSGFRQLKAALPKAAVLAHPEAPMAILEDADFVGSTSEMITAAETMPQDTFIVATERGLVQRLTYLLPNKKFVETPSYGIGPECKSCAECPWMAMNTVAKLEKLVNNPVDPVTIPANVAEATSRLMQTTLTQQA